MIGALIFGVLAVAGGLAALGLRVVNQYERGVVFRFGRALPGVRGPGLAMIMPIADRLKKVNVQVITRRASPGTT